MTGPGRRVVALAGSAGPLGTELVRRLQTDRALGVVALPYRPDIAAWAAPQADPVLVEAMSGCRSLVYLAGRASSRRGVGPQREVAVLVESALAAGVEHLVVGSCIVAYSPARRGLHVVGGRGVDEDWPALGVPGSPHSAERVAVEQAATLRCVAARRPLTLLRTGLMVADVPHARRLGVPARLWPGSDREASRPRPSVQAVSFEAAAAAFEAAVLREVDGAFNVVEEAPVPLRLNGIALQPGWMDAATRVPLMGAQRIRSVLRWRPRRAERAVRSDGDSKGQLDGGSDGGSGGATLVSVE